MKLEDCIMGQYVSIDNKLEGTIKGHAALNRDGTVQPMVLIELDKGFWSEHKNTFISVMVVHPDSLILIKDNFRGEIE